MKLHWTIIFFIHEVSEYRNYVDELFAELLSIPLEGHVKIVLLYDELLDGSTSIRNPKLYEIDQSTGRNTLKVVKEFKEFNMSDGADWAKILTAIKASYLAKRYMLFTWGHGYQFGIAKNASPDAAKLLSLNQDEDQFFEIVSNTQSPYKNAKAESTFNKLSLKKGVQLHLNQFQPSGVIKAKEELRILWMYEMAAALQKSFGERKIDLLLMMNCYMQVFDNGYELRKQVEYLIAPETAMKFDGYPYSAIVSTLNEEPEISNARLSKRIIREYVNKYTEMGNDGITQVNQTTLFANDLSQYKFLVPLFNNLGNILLEGMKAGDIKLQLASNQMDQSQSRVTADFADMLYLFSMLSKQYKLGTAYQLHLGKLSILLSQIVKAQFIGAAVRHTQASGMSILFPNENISQQMSVISVLYFQNEFNSSFLTSTCWDEVITAYMAELMQEQGINNIAL